MHVRSHVSPGMDWFVLILHYFSTLSKYPCIFFRIFIATLLCLIVGGRINRGVDIFLALGGGVVVK